MQKYNVTYNILICVAIFSQIFAYIIPTMGVEGWWYRFNAITMFIAFSLPIFSQHFIKNEWGKTFTMYALILSSNQLIDEFALDPTTLGINELFVGLFVIIHLLAKMYYAVKQRP